MKVADVMSAQFSGRTGWRQKAPTKREALRQLLSDGLEHSNLELLEVAGIRYGARLEELHHEKKPLHYIRTHDSFDDTRVAYRQTEKRLCTLCSKTKGEK
jgi:hypothetical protein